MDNKQQAQRTLGVELDGSTLRACLVSVERGNPVVEGHWELTSDDSDLYASLGQRTPSLRRSLEKALSVTAVPSSDLLLRPLELGLTKDSDIAAVIAYETDPVLPYPVDEAYLDWLHPKKTGRPLTVFSVRKERVAAHLDACTPLGLVPEQVSCLPAALATFSQHAFDNDGPLTMVHIAAHETTCSLVENGGILNTFTIASGLDTLTEALAADRKLSLFEAQELLSTDVEVNAIDKDSHPALLAVLTRFQQELSRTVLALKKGYSEGRAQIGLCVTGPGARVSGLETLIAQKIAIPLAEVHVPAKWKLPQQEALVWAAAIGLALGPLQLPSRQQNEFLNFRQGEHAYPHPWKRLTQPIAAYFALCTAIAITMVLSAGVWAALQTNDLVAKYKNTLTVLEQTVTDVEQQFRAHERLPATSGSEEEILSTLSRDDLDRRVTFLEKQLQGTSDAFALDPKTPRVSDLLAWLATHPQVVTTDSEGQTIPILKVMSVDYSMVKRPDKSRKKDKYRVKVDLEITSSSPREARAFHDALIAPNAFVDPNSEVKWSATQGRYKASFFLKDKTRYAVGG